uniref:protein FAM161B n=1 Tax=Doryrhamphus excisus TaxID=161450 RepID=UPI0025ADB6EF|nr:protein FAM161B [Doryrhamphus excisus]XP_057946919.1 protein FAM161B [Doryrhamphus excisus]XP_057946920.1 protein FAM161B [Doryrhamphus excisus]XP_057946921.1 protein FAM161B [Doryrhamphus excisus]
MSEPEVLLPSGLESEGVLHQRLQYLTVAVQQQLQETERRYREELERRIHHNTLLSADLDRLSSYTNEVTCDTKHGGLRRYASSLALTSDNVTSNHCRPIEVSAPVLGSSSDCKRPSRLIPYHTQQCERAASFKTTQQRKEEEEEAECKKKFSALPVPSQVKQSLFREMMEQRDRVRKQGHEQRKNFLLSDQRPFSFQEREKKKQDKLAALETQVSQQAKKTTLDNVKQSSPKLLGATDKEHCSNVHVSTTQQEKPAAPGRPKLRTAERTRREKLGFLDEKPSFQPKINHQVPDFRRLHKALQTEGLTKTPVKDVIRCQPFYLRTSALPVRQRKQSPDKLQVSSSLNRSKSCGALTSLSADTLPTYITDATRKRCMAIRMSMETRDWKNQASDNWLKNYQTKSEAMRKTVSLHAKLLDPHKSLREVYDERLQHHRQADRQRTSDYMKDLRDMKARVRERPLLFEQVKQRNAKARAEQTYRNELKKAGIKEQFVEEKGSTLNETLEDDTTPNVHRTDNAFHSSDAEEENVDDGEEN